MITLTDEFQLDDSCLGGLLDDARNEVINIAKGVCKKRIDDQSIGMVVLSLQVHYGEDAVDALNDLCGQIAEMLEVS